VHDAFLMNDALQLEAGFWPQLTFLGLQASMANGYELEKQHFIFSGPAKNQG
jgi:hypothetical protein